MKILKAIVVVIGLVLGAFFGLTVRAAESAPLVPRRLDHVPVSKAVQNPWPVAVMIDNHSLARPQSGLQKASLVYETLAEGGIPRFMGIFVDTNIKRIGPVRSTRPYFVRYAAEWGAAMAHAGGSPDGLQAVKDMKLLSIFALKDPTAKYFFRWNGTGIHSLYTNTDQLKRALVQGKLANKKPTYQPYAFKLDASVAKRGKNKSGVTIDLAYGTLYDAKYVYDRKNNVYVRYTGGRVQVDRLTGKPVVVKNVLLLTVPKEIVLDRKGRLDIKNVGSDKGLLLQNGKATPITWVKKTPRARTIFKDSKGKEIALVTGNTWVTIVPRGHSYKLF